MGCYLKKLKFKSILAYILAVVMVLTGINLTQFISVEAATEYVTLYFIDNTAEQWVKNDAAKIKAIDNSNGHTEYWMTQNDEITWSVKVPKSAYNITFNRYSADGMTQWNSWSAGGRDENNAYYADGSEYGHWGVAQNNSTEKNYFHAGDIVYLDLREFTAWKNNDALMYINFSSASKEENNGQDINILNANETQYKPKHVDIEVQENVYAYVIGFEDEGATELRFWRGSSSTLWNNSVLLTYEDCADGLNCVKVTGWDDIGVISATEYDMDTEVDSDGDGLPDYYETIYGLNIHNIDSDNDGLTDSQEICFTKTNPLKYDSVTDDVSDADIDNDNDGLNNGREVALGTAPNNADSDEDGLSDGEEVNIYNTDPCNADTDNDTLKDGDEIQLNFSPLLVDTDYNGVWDCDERILQTLEVDISNMERTDISRVSVEFEGTGYINSTTSIEDLYGKDMYVSDTVGLVGVPVEINSTSEFESAIVKFYMDSSYTLDDLNNLLILWYDEENDKFVEQETTINESDMSVSAEVNHFSKYMVVDKTEWFDVWRNEITYVDGSEKVYDTVIAIDCSGSMSINDPNFQYTVRNTLYPGSIYDITTCYRKLASESFVKAQKSDDQTGIVLFTSNASVACGLTNIEFDLITAIDTIYSSGGTNFDSAVNTSTNMLINARTNSEKMILLVSDGESSISSTILNAAISNSIKINTVYIGGQNNNELLKSIAEQTGGQYFKAVTADELIDIYSEIIVDQRIDSTDSDEDGLPDIIEILGMKLSNGTVIYTDPLNPDTDNDGLLDGEEINAGPTYWLNTIFDINDIPVQISAYVFMMSSNPSKKDTDGDGINDKDDPLRLIFGFNKRMSTSYKADLYNEIDAQIREDFSLIMENKNIGYYSTEDCLDILYKYDELITDVSNKYLIPKASIQTILLRELRCYDVMDDLVDSFVVQQFSYWYLVEKYNESEWYQQLLMGYPSMPIPYREDSSVGYGQIFAETAIDALNWYKHITYGNGNEYDYNDWHTREYIWNKLRTDNDFNIEMVALVLIWGANDIDLNNNYWKYTESEIKKMLSRYNGTNSDADEYGEEAYHCYIIFDKYNRR